MELALVVTTLPDGEAARTLARALVEERLAACVNIVPGVQSIYRWQGSLCDEGEVICLIKTRPERLEALRARLPALHPYEVPEVMVLPASQVHPPYLKWVIENT